MDQATIDRAVNIATRAALNGHPVERVIWIPPQSAAHNPAGAFAVQHAPPLSAADTAPWDR